MCDGAALLDGVLDGFESQASAEYCAGMIGAIAGGEDVWIGRAPIFIDDDAVINLKTGVLCEFHARNRTDADDHQVGVEACAIDALDGLDACVTEDALNFHVGVDVDALALMDLLQKVSNGSGGDACEDSLFGFKEGDLQAFFDGDGCDFQSDIATADDDQSCTRAQRVFKR